VNDKGNNFLITVLSSVISVKGLILASILVLPAITYFYVTQGSNNFIKLEVIGHEGHQIPDFSFINQNNEVVINDSFKGNIYITNFFFTSCPTICPVMTKNMAYVQDKLSTFPNIKFLSHTVDPLNDTPERMLNYVNELKVKNVNINLSNWDFVTGEKEELYKIAQSYFVNVSMDSLAPGGFLHSEYFVLIDKEGRVRSGIDKNNNVVGVYDGTNDAQMKDLVNDVNVLMAEYKKPKKEDEE
jgi:protein SCO1/2|tara:strand:- start:5554 stop:6279 length:726 start_codon:yes stop_codon:yes gene_type:complete